MEQVELPYQVRLEKFEGPLDLLLHLIRQNQINIYDIPIALIAQQYLDYLETMRSLNLAVAGEFLVMAATLLQIKSRMLLPIEERALDDEDGPDPREELVRRLLEYKQFKEAATELEDQSRRWRNVFARAPEPLPAEEPEEYLAEDVSLFELVDALHDILARTPAATVSTTSTRTSGKAARNGSYTRSRNAAGPCNIPRASEWLTDSGVRSS